MNHIIYVQIYKGDRQFVAEGLNLPVVTQGKTLDETVKNLQEALALHLESEDLASLDLEQKPHVLVNFELPQTVYA